MAKSANVLEKKVEWIALGLAGVWVIWVLWGYWISSPVATTIGGQTVTPGKIDEKVAAACDDLKNKLKNEAPAKIDIGDTSISLSSYPPRGLAHSPMLSPPAYSKLDGTPPKKIELAGTTQPTTPGELPNLADIKPRPIVVTDGLVRAVVPKPVPPAGVAGAVVPPPVVARPVAMVGGAPAGGDERDMDYATAFFFLSFKDIDAAFTKASVPENPGGGMRAITANDLILERVEVDVNGNEIGQPKVIPPLQTPEFDRNVAAQLPNFLNWVMQPQAQQQILTPSFYAVVGQGQWQGVDADGKPLPVANVNALAVLPAQPATNLPPGTPPELANAPGIGANPFDANSAANLYRSLTPALQTRYKSLLKTADRNAMETIIRNLENRGRRPGTGEGGGRRGYSNDAQDPRVMKEMYAQAEPDWLRREKEINRRANQGNPPPPPDQGTAAPPPPPPQVDPWTMRGRGRYMRPAPGVIMAQGVSLQVNAAGDAIIWAHDTTAEPGKTYKYRVRVAIKNPLYDIQGVKPEVAKVLDLGTGWSDWTKPVTLPNFVNIFFAGTVGKDPNKAAKMYVSRWQNGQMNTNPDPFVVGPGDVVGAKNGDIDFSTGWAVVDIDDASGDNRVVLMDGEGRTQVRSESEDKPKLTAPEPDPMMTPAVPADIRRPSPSDPIYRRNQLKGQ